MKCKTESTKADASNIPTKRNTYVIDGNVWTCYETGHRFHVMKCRVCNRPFKFEGRGLRCKDHR